MLEKENIFKYKARKVHGDKYDYSKVEYVNNKTKVCIICPEHGEFMQSPNMHLRGNGCPKCAKNHKMTLEVFITKAKEVHGDKYDYSKVEYVNTKTKVCIICPEHGEFEQTPEMHLQGNGCPKCAGNQNMSRDEFIQRARYMHNEKYDYSKVDYVNNKTKIWIICPEHGEFEQTPHSHLRGNGCPKCGYIKTGEALRCSSEDFIAKARNIHGDKYDYSKVDYVNNCTKIYIICPIHGEFMQSPGIHLQGAGCPKCNSSHLEEEIRDLLEEHNIQYSEQQKFDWLIYNNQMSLDFYLPEYNVTIECQGRQHFEPVDYFGGMDSFLATKNRDCIKKQLCNEHGIRVLYFSNLGIEYPYQVIEDKNELITEIRK